MNRTMDARPKQPVAVFEQRTTTQPLMLPLLVAAAMMLGGVAMRSPTAVYDGAPDQAAFNNYIFQYLGAYSDITSLWFRDQLWTHPVPYFGYPVEYPVGMGMLIWLINFVNSDVMSYFLATAAVMIGCGLLVVWLARKWPGANLWLLALSPTLPLYVVLNWDMFGILLLVAALLLFHRDRDGWGAVLLAAAVWTKFFPIVLVPLILLDRVLRRRWRDAFTIAGVFGAASLLINAPFALLWDSYGLHLRPAWLHFFTFNQQRPREVNFWNFFDSVGLSLQQINTWSAMLLAGGVGVIMLLMWLGFQRASQPRDLVLPAALAAIAWFFFINKVYSPQYSLWLAVLLALLAAPPALAVVFAAVDVMYFAASFIVLYLTTSQNPATNWFHGQVMFQAMAFREAAILALIVWAAWRIVNGNAPIHAAAHAQARTSM